MPPARLSTSALIADEHVRAPRPMRPVRERGGHHVAGEASDGLEALDLPAHPSSAGPCTARRRERFLSCTCREARSEAYDAGWLALPDGWDAPTAPARGLLLAAPGLTNPEIGTRLGTSLRTAEAPRANLFGKFGDKSHQKAIRYVIRR